jgi:rhomboid protease GluP
MDWSLALVSQGIESIIDFSEATGWGLIVDAPAQERALRTIQQYRVENLRWPWRRKIREQILFDWASLLWVLLISLFFWLGETGVDLSNAGAMNGAAVSRGEWWRLFTAMFLHADLGHLVSNAGFGLLLLGLAMGRYGTGVGLFAAYLAGAGGNVLTWMVDGRHRSLGASGMVMGALGLLAVQSVPLWRKNPHALKFALAGLAAGGMLFVLLGLSPGTDVVAHFGGFLSGLALGILLVLAGRRAQGTAVNLTSGALFLLLALLPWWLALSRVRHG